MFKCNETYNKISKVTSEELVVKTLKFICILSIYKPPSKVKRLLIVIAYYVNVL